MIQQKEPTLSKISLPHSGFGIASFVIGVIIVVIGIATFLILSEAQRGIMNRSDSLAGESIAYSAIGYYVLAIPGSILGLVLGIIGLTKKQKRKLFAILGVVLNILPGLSIVLFIIGAVISVLI